MLALFALNLGATPSTGGILGAMFALFPTLLAVTAGRLCDRYGSRYLMMFGTTGTALGMLTPYFWPSLTTMMVAALMCGFSQVFFNVSTQNLTGLLSTPEDRARNFSNYALTNSAGQFAGPMLGGFAIDHLSNTSASGNDDQYVRRVLRDAQRCGGVAVFGCTSRFDDARLGESVKTKIYQGISSKLCRMPTVHEPPRHRQQPCSAWAESICVI